MSASCDVCVRSSCRSSLRLPLPLFKSANRRFLLQAALRTVQYENKATIDQPSRIIQYSLSDGISFSDTQSIVVTVTEVNDLPVVNLNTTGLGFDGSLLTLQPLVTITDEDGTMLTEALVSVTTGCEATDMLQLASPAVSRRSGRCLCDLDAHCLCCLLEPHCAF